MSLFPLPQVKSLVFDQSGTYLAVGGTDIRVYICKQWSEVLNFTGKRMHCVCRTARDAMASGDELAWDRNGALEVGLQSAWLDDDNNKCVYAVPYEIFTKKKKISFTISLISTSPTLLGVRQLILLS